MEQVLICSDMNENPMETNSVQNVLTTVFLRI